MKYFSIFYITLLLLLTTRVYAEEACLVEKLTIAELKEQNAAISMQALQLQAGNVQRAQAEAKTEIVRLKELLKQLSNEKP